MKKSLLIAVVLTFVLTGCASVGVGVGPPVPVMIGDRTFTVAGLDGFNALAVRRPNPNYVLVFIDPPDGIVVDQEPVRPKPTGQYVVIQWVLDSDVTSEYTFPDDNAVSFPPSSTNPPPVQPRPCKVTMPAKKSITCAYEKLDRGRMFKYNLRVTDRNGNVLKLDPWVHQP